MLAAGSWLIVVRVILIKEPETCRGVVNECIEIRRYLPHVVALMEHLVDTLVESSVIRRVGLVSSLLLLQCCSVLGIFHVKAANVWL